MLGQEISIPPSSQQRLQSNVASSLACSGMNRLGFEAGSTHDLPVCPKPRRLGIAVPEVLKPLRCAKHSQPKSSDGSGVLNMIAEKTIDGREPICSGCLPSCYSGSPPSRTDNPLVHDVQFIQQMEVFSPFTRTKLSDKFGLASTSPI